MADRAASKMSLANKPLVELRLECERSGEWRTLVVPEDLVLHNLHRLAQHAFKPTSQDAAIERQEYAFTFQGKKLGKLKSAALCAAPLGEAFLGGGERLRYAAAGAAYAVTAGKRARGDAKWFVPRCVAGSAGTELDAVNAKLLRRRYGRNHSKNKERKELPPSGYVTASTTDDEIYRRHLRQMRNPVDFDPVAAALQVFNQQRAMAK